MKPHGTATSREPAGAAREPAGAAPEPAGAARAALEQVLDPELPVLSIVELGIVRDVTVEGAAVTVTVTPTYSGCPAMAAIDADIRTALSAAGFERVEIRTVYAPAWTTDWIPETAREKLRAHGIAPPGGRAAEALVQLDARRTSPSVACPFCGSTATVETSRFGPTPCTALHVCNACRQPFEYFKPF